MKISEHFSLKEFLTSDTAPEIAAAMTPNSAQLVALTRVANMILEPTREFISKLAGKDTSITPTSGLRTDELIEALIKAGYPASRTSQHCYGEAVDFCPPYIHVREVFRWMWKTLSCRQLILYEDEAGQPLGNLHVSVAPLNNRYVKPQFIIDRRRSNGGHIYLPADPGTGKVQ